MVFCPRICYIHDVTVSVFRFILVRYSTINRPLSICVSSAIAAIIASPVIEIGSYGLFPVFNTLCIAGIISFFVLRFCIYSSFSVFKP